MIRFVFESFVFKRAVISFALFVVLNLMVNGLFDGLWNSNCSIALTDLSDVYFPPVQYDNFYKVNISFVEPDRICIEGNSKLKIEGSGKGHSYFDTAKIVVPQNTNDILNKIYFGFEGSSRRDSIYLTVSKTEKPDVFWKQIFFSSVEVKNVNHIGIDTANFRIDKSKLVSSELLENNDTLINAVLNYFNVNKDSLKLGECGRNSFVLQSVCEKFHLPCRTLLLQGGNDDNAGYDKDVGYPLHAVCEVYSSHFKKWYVIDPTYGFRFNEKGNEDYLNAVEICNRYFFAREKDVVQDSVLFTKRSILERDYFKYYENVYFNSNWSQNRFVNKFLQVFYGRFNYIAYLYANNTPFVRNGKNYLIIKSLLYLFILIVLVNYIFFILARRLIQAKMPKQINSI